MSQRRYRFGCGMEAQDDLGWIAWYHHEDGEDGNRDKS
jgi:hypothetical protein